MASRRQPDPAPGTTLHRPAAARYRDGTELHRQADPLTGGIR